MPKKSSKKAKSPRSRERALLEKVNLVSSRSPDLRSAQLSAAVRYLKQGLQQPGAAYAEGPHRDEYLGRLQVLTPDAQRLANCCGLSP